MKKKLLLFIVSLILFIIVCFLLRSGKVSYVYQDISYDAVWERECRSTIVLVDHVPLLKSGLRSLWKDEQNKILKKWNPLVDSCDYILFVKNKTELPHDKKELQYWIGDYQLCLKGIIGNCISKDDRLFYLGVDKIIYGGDVVGEINGGKIYMKFLD
ncbi:hypothetical protein EC843_101883 [Buttiauxella sp. JUb87]|uniref:hypothetical protein n=1 Tax=Buttiauxella sp. JUb87 TaxID=2485129 RepID=UPI00105E0B61|nr:hypothetical protein [Buttiauxella sp. JUb87]TDN54825.1 hypothetical protein EC843_101883 [Buttiauxella sp. JUb87]